MLLRVLLQKGWSSLGLSCCQWFECTFNIALLDSPVRLGILPACKRLLIIDANSAAATAGFSIQRVGGDIARRTCLQDVRVPGDLSSLRKISGWNRYISINHDLFGHDL